ncbi:unnamed protein product [Heligmosomoides polygyrus]|uniref:DUF2511 domain-containing protein n=1 Tax=Heligmosomoides polygyrus TaxID=6339 RepID=A0A183GAT0_HELPZ|nr:unnamed protein product [Heligmosomoides polygyrus]
MRFSVFTLLLAASSIFLPVMINAKPRVLDYQIVIRGDRNCFFSPIGCLFFSGKDKLRLRQHRKRTAAV